MIFGLLFCFFVWLFASHYVHGVFTPSFTSPLLPIYGKYYLIIKGVSLFLKSFGGILGIILFYEKKNAGWAILLISLLCCLICSMYFSITRLISGSSSDPTFLVVDGLFMLGILFLSSIKTMKKFHAGISRYFLCFLIAITISLAEIFAFEISWDLIYLFL